jgi:rhamnosyltransferase
MPRPRVLILLAAYNGEKWIRQQLESILAQEGVELTVAIRDDGSSDGTLEEIARFSADDRVQLSPHSDRAGSAAQNFLALIVDHAAEDFDFVAFSDQDDIWHRNKLIRACRALSEGGFVGYSSATVAQWSDGRSAVLSQADAITATDFLFEGAGQGCTFVLRADFYGQARRFVRTHRSLTRELHYHDWMVYALARSWGYSWTFDPSPSTTYRQHGGNDTGARSTAAGARKRLALLRSGWYCKQLILISVACAAAAPGNGLFERWVALLGTRRNWRRRLRVALLCIRGGRRKKLDNLVVILAALAGWI